MRELLLPSCLLLVRLSLFLSATSWVVNQWWELRLDGSGYILRITHDGIGLYRTGWSTRWSAQVSRTPDAYFHRGFAPRPVVFSDQPLDQEFFRQVPGILCWRFEQLPSIWFVGIRHWLLFAGSAFGFAVLTVLSRRRPRPDRGRPVKSGQSAETSSVSTA
ncbi:MAG: hypothetical protein NXI04_02855 [Planctomycetaceae bacterium]|nr:hypothetical protein [Planctomycetaceae bacterium]